MPILRLCSRRREKSNRTQTPSVPNHQAVPATAPSSQITTNRSIKDIHNKSTRVKTSILKQISTINPFKYHQAAPVKQNKVTGVLPSNKLLFKRTSKLQHGKRAGQAQQSVTTLFSLLGPDFGHSQESENHTRQTKRYQAGVNTAPCTTASKQTVKRQLWLLHLSQTGATLRPRGADFTHSQLLHSQGTETKMDVTSYWEPIRRQRAEQRVSA